MSLHQLIPLTAYCLALLLVALLGTVAIGNARQHLAPAPIQEVL